MTVYVARNRTNAVEHINSRLAGTVDLDYETAWQDAFELGRLGQQYGVVVQFRTIEHVAVRSPEALVRGLRAPKLTFRQRHLYCLFDLTELPEACLCELEARAVQHGDYVLAGHLLKESTLTWD
ncbi:PHA-granule associated protein 4 (plasmid) [Cupriavidus basilensis]